MKFKKGDQIVPTESYQGFENATVTGIIKQNGKQYYTLRIIQGTATIPVSAEEFYKLKTNKK